MCILEGPCFILARNDDDDHGDHHPHFIPRDDLVSTITYQ